MNRLATMTTILLTLWISLLTGCGGGSEGTGVTARTIQGTVETTRDQPLPGVMLTVVATGDSTVTDQSGNFSLETEVTDGDVQLQVEGPDLNTTVVIEDVLDDSSVIDVDIKVNPQLNEAAISNIEVLAKIVGACDRYFENRRIIRQSNAAPDGILCTAKVWVKGDGIPLGGVPIAVQHRRCSDRSEWKTIAEGITATDVHTGIGQVAFPFFDDREHCVYRIVAPHNVDEVAAIEYQVHTFTKQNFEKERK